MRISLMTLILLLLPTLTWGADLNGLYEALKTAPRSQDMIYMEAVHPNMWRYSSKESPHVQQVIDQAFTDILRTSTGSQLCLFLSNQAREIQGQLGVSASKSEDLSQGCRQKYPKVTVTPGPSLGKWSPRVYHFVFNIPADFPFHSWSTMNNHTYIFFDHRLSKEELYARLIHEIFISLDAKLLLGTDAGLELEKFYGAKVLNAGRGEKRIQNIRNGFGIIPFPLIKFSLSALRATVAESWILSEIFGEEKWISQVSNPVIFRQLKAGKKWNMLKVMLHSLVDYQDYLMPVEYQILAKEDRRAMLASYYILENKIPLVMQAFQESPIRIRDVNKQEMPLIDWLMTPAIGAQSTFYSRGPRPRIGGGWGEAETEQKETVPEDQEITDEEVDAWIARKQQEMKLPKSKEKINVLLQDMMAPPEKSLPPRLRSR